jgi:hypothetical protein
LSTTKKDNARFLLQKIEILHRKKSNYTDI